MLIYKLHAFEVIEPYKGKSVINKIVSKSENKLEVYLTDGRKQVISVANLKGENTQVSISEFVDGVLVNSEITNSVDVK